MNRPRVIINTLSALVIALGFALSAGATNPNIGTRAFCCSDSGNCCQDCTKCNADATKCECVKSDVGF